MAIVKVSRSGKAVLFIDDEGNVFMTSTGFLVRLLEGGLKSPFLLLKRLPDKVSKDRFVPSPLIGEVVSPPSKVVLSPSVDSLSVASKRLSDEVRPVVDRPVW